MRSPKVALQKPQTWRLGIQDFQEQVVLRPEIAVDQGDVDPHVRRDLSQADVVVAVGGQTRPRRP
jgi:hypothetical protein